jgi:hypothetical protein
VPVIPALESPRQEGWKFGYSLGYMARFCLKNKKRKQMFHRLHFSFPHLIEGDYLVNVDKRF